MPAPSWCWPSCLKCCSWRPCGVTSTRCLLTRSAGLPARVIPFIGQALALLHKTPAHPWTVEELARRVGLSRTRFAERFRHFLGEPPMAYLARWRVKLGAEILQSTENSVAEVAATVGYGSEAAFNRAFKRELECPPAQFRRHHSAPPAPPIQRAQKGRHRA